MIQCRPAAVRDYLTGWRSAVRVRLQSTFYRGHDPRWAFLPPSGEGAATAGGRFNPKGVPALYLAATIDT